MTNHFYNKYFVSKFGEYEEMCGYLKCAVILCVTVGMFENLYRNIHDSIVKTLYCDLLIDYIN